MGNVFWTRFMTFAIQGRMRASRPSMVETAFARAPARTLPAHTLEAPAMLEQAMLNRNRLSVLRLVGGWEAVVRLE